MNLNDRVLFIRGEEGSGREYLAHWISSHPGYYFLNSDIDPITLKTHSAKFTTLSFTANNYQKNLQEIFTNIPDNMRLVLPWLNVNSFTPDLLDNKPQSYFILTNSKYSDYIFLENIRKNLLKPNLLYVKLHSKKINKLLIKDFISGKRARIDIDLIIKGYDLTHSNRLKYINELFLKYKNNNLFKNNTGIEWNELFFSNEDVMRNTAKKIVSDLKLEIDNNLIDNLVNRNLLNKKSLEEFNLDKALTEYSNRND